MEFIGLKDFVYTYTQFVDNEIVESMKGTGMRLAVKLGVAFDEEKFEKWIRQAIEIETFSKEQIEDLKLRRLIDKKDEEIKKLELELEVYRKKIEDLCNFNKKD